MKFNNKKIVYLAPGLISHFLEEILLIMKAICMYIIKILCNYVF